MITASNWFNPPTLSPLDKEQMQKPVSFDPSSPRLYEDIQDMQVLQGACAKRMHIALIDRSAIYISELSSYIAKISDPNTRNKYVKRLANLESLIRELNTYALYKIIVLEAGYTFETILTDVIRVSQTLWHSSNLSRMKRGVKVIFDNVSLEYIKNGFAKLEEDLARTLDWMSSHNNANFHKNNHGTSTSFARVLESSVFTVSLETNHIKVWKMWERVRNLSQRIILSDQEKKELLQINQRLQNLDLSNLDRQIAEVRSHIEAIFNKEVTTITNNRVLPVENTETQNLPSFSPLSDAERENIVQYFRDLRVDLRIPSSTNHSKEGSESDGSFTISALKPFLNFIEQWILSWRFKSEFTFAEVVRVFRLEVETANSPNMLKYFIQSLENNTEITTLQRLHIDLANKLVSLRGRGLFAENAFLILEKRLRSFDPLWT